MLSEETSQKNLLDQKLLHLQQENSRLEDQIKALRRQPLDQAELNQARRELKNKIEVLELRVEA